MSKDYTLIVCVKNTFAAATNVGIKVHQYCTVEGYNITPCSFIDYSIPPGECHPFLLNNTDEYLEISPSNHTSSLITAGITAKAKCEVDGKPKEPKEGKRRIYIAVGEDYYTGGIWELDESEADWKLTIKEYNFDPQTDDVVIGPPPPQV